MKKSILVTLVGLMLSASLAMAAAPAAPVLSVVSGKIAEGHFRAPGSKVITADGTTFYTAFATPIIEGFRELRLVRSTDGGLTWKGSHKIISAPETSLYGGYASVSVSGDAAFPTQKIVHVVWQQDDRIYYTWADATDLDIWSPPVDVMGSVASGGWEPGMVTSKTGAIHVTFRMSTEVGTALYYSSATAHDAGFFSTPVALVAANEYSNSDAELTMDKSNNLHLSYPFTDGTKIGVRYKKLAAGSSNWTSPVTVAPLYTSVNGGPFTSITSFDASNLYIASQDEVNLNVFRSTNGGATWTKKTVFAKTTTVNPTRHVSIAVNASKALMVGTGFDTYATNGDWVREDAKVFKSTDGGVTWSAATTIVGQTSVSIAVDSNGKAGISTYSASGTEGECAVYLSKEK